MLTGGGDAPLGRLDTKDGKIIRFYMVVPTYKEEIQYKLKYGMEKLEELFQGDDFSMVLDIHRPNLCAGFHEVLDADTFS